MFIVEGRREGEKEGGRVGERKNLSTVDRNPTPPVCPCILATFERETDRHRQTDRQTETERGKE